MRNFILTVVAILFLIYIFVYLQYDLIEYPFEFWFLIIILVIFSFWSSATEAAFSRVDDGTDLGDRAQRELNEVIGKIEKYDQKGTLNLNKSEIKDRSRLTSKAKRKTKKQQVMNGLGKSEIVGSLSSLSLLLNLGLVTALNSVVLSRVMGGDLLCIPTPELFSNSLAICNNATLARFYSGLSHYVGLDHFFEFTSDKALVFFASSVPILIFGKIIPKMVGLKNQEFFAYRNYWFGSTSNFFLGWLSRSAIFFLKDLLKVKV